MRFALDQHGFSPLVCFWLYGSVFTCQYLDFQLFLIAPLVVLLFFHHRRIGAAVGGVLPWTCVLAMYLILHHTDDPQGPKLNDLVYDKPYTRGVAFFLGIATAFLHYSHGPRRLHWATRTCIYLALAGAMPVLVFVTYTAPWSRGTSRSFPSPPPPPSFASLYFSWRDWLDDLESLFMGHVCLQHHHPLCLGLRRHASQCSVLLF